MSKLSDIIQRGTAGAIPAASSVPVGTLYYKTDTGAIVRSNGATWDAYSSSASGDVVGPGSATDSHVALFDGTSGKLLKSGGVLTSGDTVGPGSATDGHMAVFDGTSGKLIKDGGAPGAGGGSWFPFVAFTPPVDGDFAWVNQGGASINTSITNTILLSAPSNAGDSLRCRVQAVRAAPYTVTAFVVPYASVGNSNYVSLGLMLRDSGSGKIVTFALGNNDTGINNPMLHISMKFTNETTYSATYASQVWTYTPYINLAGYYIRIYDDNTNRKFQISGDGIQFSTLHTIGRTDFITANQVGFYVDMNNASNVAGLRVLSWVQAAA